MAEEHVSCGMVDKIKLFSMQRSTTSKSCEICDLHDWTFWYTVRQNILLTLDIGDPPAEEQAKFPAPVLHVQPTDELPKLFCFLLSTGSLVFEPMPMPGNGFQQSEQNSLPTVSSPIGYFKLQTTCLTQVFSEQIVSLFKQTRSDWVGG